MLCGRTCGRSVVKVPMFHRGRFSDYNAAGAKRQRQYGGISVPLSHFVGRAEKVPAGGGPKPDGRYATRGNCRRCLEGDLAPLAGRPSG